MSYEDEFGIKIVEAFIHPEIDGMLYFIAKFMPFFLSCVSADIMLLSITGQKNYSFCPVLKFKNC
jgi:hypothetical protein